MVPAVIVVVYNIASTTLTIKKMPGGLLNKKGRFKFVGMKILQRRPYKVSELCKLYDVHSMALAAMMESKGLSLHKKVNSEEDYRFGEKEVEMIFKSLGHPIMSYSKS